MANDLIAYPAAAKHRRIRYVLTDIAGRTLGPLTAALYGTPTLAFDGERLAFAAPSCWGSRIVLDERSTVASQGVVPADVCPVQLATPKGRVLLRRDAFRVSVHCSAGCAGGLLVVKNRRWRDYASDGFEIAPGGRKKVTVRVAGRTRRALAAGRAVRVALQAKAFEPSDVYGDVGSTTRTFTLVKDSRRR